MNGNAAKDRLDPNTQGMSCKCQTGETTVGQQPDLGVAKQAEQALPSIGYLRRTAELQHVVLFDAMIRYERLTGRSLFAGAQTFDQAALELIVDIDRRNCALPDDFHFAPGGRVSIKAYGPTVGVWSTGNLSCSVK